MQRTASEGCPVEVESQEGADRAKTVTGEQMLRSFPPTAFVAMNPSFEDASTCPFDELVKQSPAYTAAARMRGYEQVHLAVTNDAERHDVVAVKCQERVTFAAPRLEHRLI